MKCFLLIAAAALALVACDQAKFDSNLEKAKQFASQVGQVVEKVCDVVPKGAVLINAVMGMEPTTVALTTVATTFCVGVLTPKTTNALVEICPGGVMINDTCVPYDKGSP